MGSVVLLDGEAISPGRSGRAQLVLRATVGAGHRDRIVLRDASASRTIAGGFVLDPCASAWFWQTPTRHAQLDAWVLADHAARRDALQATAPHGLDLNQLARAEGIAPMPIDNLPSRFAVAPDGHMF